MNNLGGKIRNVQEAQEKAAYADYRTSDAPPSENLNKNAQGLGMGGQQMACEESIVSRLRRQQRTTESEYQKNQHALEILERQPEFEDFLWLLRANII